MNWIELWAAIQVIGCIIGCVIVAVYVIFWVWIIWSVNHPRKKKQNKK